MTSLPFLSLGSPSARRRFYRASLGCAILMMVSVLWNQLSFLAPIERFTLDYRYAHFNRTTRASDQVLVIDIDDSSMKLLGPHLGRWPWSRKIYKQLIEFLAQGEPAGIYFDLLFTEASQTDDGDLQVAEASAQAKSVSHAMLLSSQPSVEVGQGFVPFPPSVGQKFGFQWTGKGPVVGSLPVFRDFNLPTQSLLDKIPRVHVVTSEKDSDGIFRRTPIFFNYPAGISQRTENSPGQESVSHPGLQARVDEQSIWLPSLALQAVSARIKNPQYSWTEGREGGVLHLDGQLGAGESFISHLDVPLDSKGMLPLHYYRPDRDIEIIPIAAAISSATRLQSGEVSDLSQLQLNPLSLKDKIIIIGASAEGLFDLKATPVSAAYPGPMLHATAISNILLQDFLKKIPDWIQVGLNGMTLLLVYFSVFLFTRVFAKILIPALWMGGYAVVSFYLFQKQSLALEMARPLLLGGVAVFDGLIYLVVIEGRDKRKLKETLSKYLPPSVSDQIIASGQDPRAEVGQTKELSILFSDIRGFTSLSEKVNPSELVSLLNQYLGRMTDVIFQEMGTLDKFIGDAIMAFWGAPISNPDHAVQALRCAFRMKSTLKQLNQEWQSRGINPLKIGIGINTGPVIVGNIGSEKRLDYTVIGDHVNLASRLESITKQYSVEFIIGDRTEELVRNSFICRPIDFVAVKGKQQCVKIYEPLAEISDPMASQFRELSAKFGNALGDYQVGNFELALNQFQRLEQDFKDAVSGVFAKRCVQFLVNPPGEGWDGVFVAQDK